MARAGGAQDQHPGEGGGHGAEGEPQHDVLAHGAPAPVEPAAQRLHDERGHQIARDRGQGSDAEEQDQDRGHERATTHASQSDCEANQQACNGDG